LDSAIAKYESEKAQFESSQIPGAGTGATPEISTSLGISAADLNASLKDAKDAGVSLAGIFGILLAALKAALLGIRAMTSNLNKKPGGSGGGSNTGSGGGSSIGSGGRNNVVFYPITGLEPEYSTASYGFGLAVLLMLGAYALKDSDEKKKVAKISE
jgi:hypothetical protein